MGNLPQPHSLSCFLCCDNIVPYNIIDTKRDIFEERFRLARSLKKQHCTKHEQNDPANHYFDIPWYWKCLARKLVVDPGGCYKLSPPGIPGWFWSTAENHTRIVVADAHRLPTHPEQLNNIHLGDLEEKLRGGGYRCSLVHERCWELMKRVIDPCLVENNMGSFATHVSVREKYVDDIEWRKQVASSDGGLHMRDPAAFVSQYSKNWECKEALHALRDPWKVIDVKNSIETEVAMFGEEEETEQASILALSPKLRDIKVLRLNVLADIVMVILDFLPESDQARKLMWAFPHWAVKVPFGYWRKRFIVEFMLEDEKSIPDSAALNWRRLYYKSRRIHRESHGLHNRQRILKHLKTVEVLFKDEMLVEPLKRKPK